MRTFMDQPDVPSSAEAPYKQKPEGGKALARLNLFLDQRGFAEEAPAGTKKKGSKSRSRAGDAESFAADEDIGEIYAAAAVALQADSAAGAEGGEESAPRAMADADITEPPPPPPVWRFLGPSLMHNGQTYGSSRADVSGRIAAIAIDPGNRNHILAGSAAGGIWESITGGASWSPRTDFMPTCTTGAIAFTPSNPLIVYAGTGEGNWWARLGAGVLRSTNGGTTWSLLTGAPFVGQGFFDLLVDPANALHLLAATTGGLYESANGGTVWTQRRAARTWAISMRAPGGPTSEVLAACSDGLFRSTNGGTTWAAVALPGAAPGAWTRLSVAHARSNPAVAFAFGVDSSGAGRLYRRSSAGTWASVGLPPGLALGQAWYDWFLAVAPNSENRIYCGAIEVHRGDFNGSSWTWTNITAKPSGDSIHPDQHAMAFDPTDPNTIFVGNDGGLYRSPNAGVNWQSLNSGLGITEIEYMAQDVGTSRWIMAGTQDNGSIRYTGSPVWDHIADGDGGDCGVNRVTPTTVFHSYFGMGMERSTTKGNFGSFGWIGQNVPANYQALFYPPMECTGDTVAQAGQSVFVSRNNGTSFVQIALPAGCVGSAMYIPDPNHVYVGCTNGRLFRIDWTGSAWSAANALTVPRNAWISDIFVDPGLNRIWVTISSMGGGRVFRSDNAGVAWVDCSAGLPNLPMNAVQVDPANANRIWVAADLGVYQSLNAGASWSTFSLGLPNAFIGDLIFHPHSRVLRAGMRNRGVWEIPVDGWLVTPILGTQFVGTLAPNAQQTWFTFNWPAPWHVIWTAMPVTPKPGAPELTWNVEVERANAEYVTYWITAKNLTNVTVQFEGRYAILSKY